jgi:ABC-type sugar transport system substrate-binding protein
LLIVSPNVAAPITPVVERAYQKGIKVIIVDRRTLSENYTAYVGASNYEVGESAAVYANSILKGTATYSRYQIFPVLLPTLTGILVFRMPLGNIMV